MKNLKTHYDPFQSGYDPYGEDASEVGYCGTLLSEDGENVTNNREYVSCKKCIRLFKVADEEMKQVTESQIEFYKGFVEANN